MTTFLMAVLKPSSLNAGATDGASSGSLASACSHAHAPTEIENAIRACAARDQPVQMLLPDEADTDPEKETCWQRERPGELCEALGVAVKIGALLRRHVRACVGTCASGNH